MVCGNEKNIAVLFAGVVNSLDGLVSRLTAFDRSFIYALHPVLAARHDFSSTYFAYCMADLHQTELAITKSASNEATYHVRRSF